MLVSVTESLELGRFVEPYARLRLRSPEAVDAMQASLGRYGLLTALLVMRHPEGFVVLDGHKRLEAARRLGWSQIRTELCQVSSADALSLVWQANIGTEISELEEAWIIKELYRGHKLKQVDIGALFGRHKSWVSRRLMLAEDLSESLEAQVRLGLVTPTSARELARLPRGNQDEVSRWALSHGLTTRQVSKLVERLLRIPDRGAWSTELKRSEKTRSKEVASAPAASTPTIAEEIVADVEALKRNVARLQARLLSRPLGSLTVTAREVLVDVLKPARALATALALAIDSYLNQGDSL